MRNAWAGRLRKLKGARPLRGRFQWRAGTSADAYREAIAHTRGLVLAEALLLLIVGFSLDDVRALRVPGFLVGAAGAVLVLAFGGLVHGWRLARSLEGLEPARAQARLRRFRGAGRAAALLSALAFLAWLVAFSQGVPPWAL